jgi:hypothetical protein
VIQLRQRQPSLWHSGLAKDIEDLWEPWMKEVDQLLEDAALVESVYDAQGKRHRKSRTHGRAQTPAEVALRLLILKHVRNWSYDTISTGDQHAETQLYDLRELAKQRRFEIVYEYTDTISGAKSKRPGLDQDARRHRFDVVLVAAFDRVARNVRHFLEVLDELGHLNIEFVSLRENIDTGGPLGRAMVVIVGAIA